MIQSFIFVNQIVSFSLTLLLCRKEMEEWFNLLSLSVKLSFFFSFFLSLKKKWKNDSLFHLYHSNYLFLFLFFLLCLKKRKGKMSCSFIFDFFSLSQSCKIVECNLWITQNCALSISIILLLSFKLSFFFPL